MRLDVDIPGSDVRMISQSSVKLVPYRMARSTRFVAELEDKSCSCMGCSCIGCSGCDQGIQGFLMFVKVPHSLLCGQLPMLP